MIRIPFSTGSDACEVPSTSVEDASGSLGARDQLESRMLLLENKLGHHAEELKSSIEQRVDRIESRVSRALVSLGSEAEEEEEANVVEFQSSDSGNEFHHLPAVAALAALNELNDTLELTRNHMRALDLSVARMKKSLQ